MYSTVMEIHHPDKDFELRWYLLECACRVGLARVYARPIGFLAGTKTLFPPPTHPPTFTPASTHASPPKLTEEKHGLRNVEV